MDENYNKRYSITKSVGQYRWRDNETNETIEFSKIEKIISHANKLSISLHEIHLSRSLSNKEQNGISEKLK
jgi:hypothetical protein